MDNVGYVALSAQVSLRRNLDVVANNVANMNTVGFKADKLLFAEAMSRASGSEGAKPVSFVADTHTWTDFSEGPVRQTGNDLNVALAGEGFLAVETPEGISYTRDGRFAINPENVLVNMDGNPVLNADGAPIQLPQNVESISIGSDGSLSANGALVARLGVFVTPDPETMTRRENSAFVSAAVLEPAENPQVMQGMLEDSNVSGIIEMTRLIDVTRAYGHADSIAETADKLQKDAVSKIGRV